ncbi:DUF6314 family protein [Ruegeria marina]|uniref:DUF6314 domain-containing protein n=1 Tax=Ruegeria marina TaxID=639004 RepID=A0A1G6QJ05_9RHOB|nr:DUF6314 family protein [Ruegeria marina]SDC91894.1 hypothetical protein SAMN04488239_104131 [Ruegeria marina]
MNGPERIEDFEGDWHLTRAIDDRLAGQVLRAEGVATLRRGDGQFVYDEEVALHIPGQQTLRGTRRYLWRPAPGRIAIHFEDGRFFHNLTLGQSASEDHHDCAPDSYDAAYDFARWPCWSVRWSVSGPRKSYEMRTEFSPR